MKNTSVFWQWGVGKAWVAQHEEVLWKDGTVWYLDSHVDYMNIQVCFKTYISVQIHRPIQLFKMGPEGETKNLKICSVPVTLHFVSLNPHRLQDQFIIPILLGDDKLIPIRNLKLQDTQELTQSHHEEWQSLEPYPDPPCTQHWDGQVCRKQFKTLGKTGCPLCSCQLRVWLLCTALLSWTCSAFSQMDISARSSGLLGRWPAYADWTW